MRTCSKCVLSETFPGISFNEEGVCNFCLGYKGKEFLEAKKQEYRLRFNDLAKEHKGKNTYDALMCYSGGKDSTYTLAILKEEYGFNILALTFDNGFIPEQALRNISNVVENLDVDHLFFKPRFNVLKKIFNECGNKSIYSAKTLERASTICTSCMGIVKFIALRTALESHIPFICFGWSPGQAPIESSVFKNNPAMVKDMQKVIFEPLHKIVGDQIKPYFLDESYFNGRYTFPYNINLLALLDYNENEILKKISHLSWRAPEETDSSTNCLLNSYAIFMHEKQFNFHPYVHEMAKLVREGYVNRERALEKLNKPINRNNLVLVRKKLGIEDQ